MISVWVSRCKIGDRFMTGGWNGDSQDRKLQTYKEQQASMGVYNTFYPLINRYFDYLFGFFVSSICFINPFWAWGQLFVFISCFLSTSRRNSQTETAAIIHIFSLWVQPA